MVNQTNTHDNHPPSMLRNALQRLALASLVTATSGCTPPGEESIFVPYNEHFDKNSATIVIKGLSFSTSVCYTTDGSEPVWNEGSCGGGNTRHLPGPVEEASITIACDGQTADRTPVQVRIAFDWTGSTEIHYAQSQYMLNCASDGGGSGDDVLTPSKNSYLNGETVSIQYIGGSGSKTDWIGIFESGNINEDCVAEDTYLTWKYTNGSAGTVHFSDLSPGSYQAQMFANDGYCYIGNPVSFSISNDGVDHCPDDPDKTEPGDCGCGVPEGTCGGNGNAEVTINPYSNVNWSWQQYKANFHTHTTRSDGDDSPEEVIDNYYNADYKILSITDHNTITWPWSDYGRNPSSLNMLAVKGDEYSSSHHVNVFDQFSLASADHSKGVKHVQSEGGLCHFNHPYRYNKASDWDWYVPWYRQYPACVGLETINRNTKAHELWDNLNEFMFREDNKLIWGFANDDMHDRDELFRSFQFMLMPNLTQSALNTSKKTGAFYFCNEPGGSGEARVPRINRITVDNSSKRITISASGENSIRWIGPGSQRVGTGSTFDFSNYPDKSFVRAELEGSRGTCYTQPFGIRVR